MKIQIKRIDKSLPLPQYQTDGSVAFDLYSRVDMIIEPKTLDFIPTNFIIKIPVGFMLSITPRSSTPRKKGLLSPHGVGIIDQDYHGEEDEIKLMLYNYTDDKVDIKKGERIGQAYFVPIEKVNFEEVEKMNENNRGGFGSTGTY
ncbi:MAG: dUTP diphosphatase [Candidatus Magasanikbacteria bacterium]|nr:dUTP diphosphatase [Candidatus Magasanikbacteria bacterium]